MDNIIFPCNINTTNFSTTDENEKSLTHVSFGVWFLCIVSAFGIVNNILTLIVFIRLRWHEKRQYLLLLNLASVDLINSGTFLAGSTMQLIQLYFNIVHIIRLPFCVLAWIPSNVSMTCSPVLALFIAVDRLYCIWYPIRWITMSRIYWRTLVVVAWTWATIVEGGWMFFTDASVCVKACTFVPFPNSWWSLLVKTSDITVNLGVIIIYIVIPLVTEIALKTCAVKFEIQRNEKVLVRNKEMLAQIRALSAIMITCFCCTYGISFILADFDYLEGIGGPMTPIVVQQITACLLASNSTLSFFLYLVRDKLFRQETKKLFSSFLKDRKNNVNDIK